MRALPHLNGEQRSAASAQAARGRARPPCRHFRPNLAAALGLLSRRLSKPKPLTNAAVCQWTLLATAPAAIYHHTVVVHEPTQTAFVFGGHKCGADTPTDHAYLNTVSKLRIAPKRASSDGEL